MELDQNVPFGHQILVRTPLITTISLPNKAKWLQQEMWWLHKHSCNAVTPFAVHLLATDCITTTKVIIFPHKVDSKIVTATMHGCNYYRGWLKIVCSTVKSLMHRIIELGYWLVVNYVCMSDFQLCCSPSTNLQTSVFAVYVHVFISEQTHTCMSGTYVPCTLFWSSATSRVSISHATTCRDTCTMNISWVWDLFLSFLWHGKHSAATHTPCSFSQELHSISAVPTEPSSV